MAGPDDYRRGAGYRRSTAPRAAAPEQDPAPLRQASPEKEGAKPDRTGMFSRAWDAFSIGAAWLGQLAVNDDSTLRREGAADLALYDALLDDDAAKTALDQRLLAVIEAPWVVEPGDPDDARSVQASEDLRAMIAELGFDRFTRLMLFTLWYGFGVAEGLYEMRAHDGRTIVWLKDLVVPDRKWFGFTNGGELRMKTPNDTDGVAVPPNKFFTWRTGGTHDFAHYGVGLAHWAYWPVFFKRNGWQFWAQYLEKYGQPTAVVPFVPGADDGVVSEAIKVGQAIGQDSAVAVPANAAPGATAGEWLKPYLLEASRGGDGSQGYETFKEACNDALRTVIAGQVATSSRMSTGLNSGQSDVQEGVADTRARADSDDFHAAFNATFPRWLTLWNYGPDVKPPTVFRQFDEDEGIDAIAARDKILDDLGFRRTEDSFREVYGDGYERKPEPAPLPGLPGAPGARGARPGAANDDERDQRAAVFAAGDPRPLYVSRKLLPDSGRKLLAWAAGAGFTNLVDLAELHVTICYSRAAVDWFAMPEDWSSDQDGGRRVKRGGPRMVEAFGDSATVLMFQDRELRWRHDSLVEAGASHDWDEFRLHVTFAKGDQAVDLDKVAAFDGELRFGPEVWEPLDDEPTDSLPAFSAEEMDQVDQLTAELAADLDPAVAAFGAAIVERMEAMQARGGTVTREGLRLSLLQVFEKTDAVDAIAKRLSLPFAAERAAAAIGAEDQLAGA